MGRAHATDLNESEITPRQLPNVSPAVQMTHIGLGHEKRWGGGGGGGMLHDCKVGVFMSVPV